jgi:hypothetical protein
MYGGRSEYKITFQSDNTKRRITSSGYANLTTLLLLLLLLLMLMMFVVGGGGGSGGGGGGADFTPSP